VWNPSLISLGSCPSISANFLQSNFAILIFI
jgi:hypothetical protein